MNSSLSAFSPDAKSIDEVIDRLTFIIEWSREHQSPLGYFPSLYRKVTQAVKEGIEQGRFDDGPRMEHLDVIFANRYLKAWHQYQLNQEPTQSWKIAFEAGESKSLLILQHLLLGINAHINLDLGIAAAETSRGATISELEDDFLEINRLLMEMMGAVQKEINKLSPLFKALDFLGGFGDELLASFSLKKARQNAWRVARNLVEAGEDQWEESIQQEDQRTLRLAKLIRKPGGIRIRTGLFVVSLSESRRVSKIIDMLA